MNIRPLRARPLRLLLVDPDPIFRLGLQTALASSRRVVLVEWATSPESALACLARYDDRSPSLGRSPLSSGSTPVAPNSVGLDGVLVDWQIEAGFGAIGDRFEPRPVTPSPPSTRADRSPESLILPFSARLRDRYPNLPILLLGAVPDQAIAQAEALGGITIQAKTVPIARLVVAIEQAIQAPPWAKSVRPTGLSQLPRDPSPSSVARPGSIASGSANPGPIDPNASRSVPPFTTPADLPPVPPAVSPLGPRQRYFRQNLLDLEFTLQAVAQALARPQLGQVDRWILEGRQRELRAARRFIGYLAAWPADRDPVQAFAASLPDRLPQNDRTSIEPTTAKINRDSLPTQSPAQSPEVRLGQPGSGQPGPIAPKNPTTTAVTTPAATATTATAAAATLQEVRSAAFDQVAQLLPTGALNATGSPLEIDILRSTKRQELLGLVLAQIQAYVETEARRDWARSGQSSARPDVTQVRQQEPPIESVPAIDPRLLDLRNRESTWQRQIWENVIQDFYGDFPPLSLAAGSTTVAAIVQADWPTVQADILGKAIDTPELLAYWLLGTPLAIDGIDRPLGSTEADQRALALLQNWIIRLACAVVQPLLNRLADLEPVKHHWFDVRWLSARSIERFRNDLSWAYRLDHWLRDPTAAFESRHWLLVSDGRVIERQAIYAPRNDELRSLTGVPLAVTLMIETRDAIAPRLRASFTLVGRGLLFLLEAIGRGLGQIGRGLLQGLSDPDRHKSR